MATYYIDFQDGRDDCDGFSPASARKSLSGLSLHAGDRVLFRRGRVLRGYLDTTPFVSYGAYGEGDLPTICGSVDVSREEDWQKTERAHVWKCTRTFRGDIGNLIFNRDECTAALRWSLVDLCAQGDFFGTPVHSEQVHNADTRSELWLYSEGNPAGVYSHIEVADYGDRILVRLCDGVTLEDIRVTNSGVHGMAGSGDGITVRRCEFMGIGGCPWNAEMKIRFGNGLEIWHKGSRITVEDCRFRNIYDSCVTHQGPGEDTVPTTGFICRNNTFDTYGMAAFEYRDKLPIDSLFEHNACRNAGCGFAMLGETLPRRSEIWPQPMGHHLFLWRMPGPTEGGNLLIRDNEFGPAPAGASVYSIISPEAEAQIILENNRYVKNPLLHHFGGRDYTDLETFQKQTGQDTGSQYIE